MFKYWNKIKFELNTYYYIINNMNFVLVLNKEKHPQLFKMLKKERDRIIPKLFDVGYNAYYPKQEIIENTNTVTTAQVQKLHDTINLLLGIKNNSSKKGELAENFLENYFKNNYIDIVYENKAQLPHSGDAWLLLSNGVIIMIESKNYTSSVPIDELKKMEYDMKFNKIKFGMFISWQSNLNNYKPIDFYTITFNNETYIIFIVCNLIQNIKLLDVGVKFLVKVSKSSVINFEKNNAFNAIKDDIKKLELVLKNNNNLLLEYGKMTKNINSSLVSYEKFLRKYDYDIECILNNIITRLNNKIESKIAVNKLNLFDEFKDYKTYPILMKCFENINMNNITCKLNNNEILLLKNNEIISNIKITKSKINISLAKYKHINFSFSSLDDSNSFELLKSLH